MLYFQFVIVAAVFGGIAWVAAGRGGGVVDAAPDRPDVALPDDRQLGKTDIDAARFTVGWRGYRMDEVDRVLDRLAAEIDYRDRLIAELTGPGASGVGVGSAGYQVGYGQTGGYEAASTAQGTSTQVVEGPAEVVSDTDRRDGDENPLSAWYRRPEPPA